MSNCSMFGGNKMKILLMSDAHLRTSIPAARKDDFVETQFKKWEFILKQDADIIVQAGDLFDKPTPPYSLLVRFMKLLAKYNKHIYCIYGQHDMMMRSKNLNRTALGILEAADLITIIPPEGVWTNSIEVVLLVGNSYGNGYKNLHKEDDSAYAAKILVTHDMIGDEPLFPGQEIIGEGVFQRKHKWYDIILCGDYHYPFQRVTRDERIILNTGCLTRLTRGVQDINRNISVFIYDTKKKLLEEITIPHEPAEKVFHKMDKMKFEQKDNEEILAMIEKLKNTDKLGTSYIDVLTKYYENNKVSKEVQDLVEEVLHV